MRVRVSPWERHGYFLELHIVARTLNLIEFHIFFNLNFSDDGWGSDHWNADGSSFCHSHKGSPSIIPLFIFHVSFFVFHFSFFTFHFIFHFFYIHFSLIYKKVCSGNFTNTMAQPQLPLTFHSQQAPKFSPNSLFIFSGSWQTESTHFI